MIDPITTNTARVGELPNEPFSLSDKIPHEVGIDLKSGTVQQLVDLVANVLDTTGGVGFRAVSVTDGQTLPTTTTQEFILLGKGTYYNVSGGDTIFLTKELNAVVSNGSFWFIGVEIDINAEDLGIVQTIRQGFIETSPSENAIYNAIAAIVQSVQKKISGSNYPDYVAQNAPISITSTTYQAFPLMLRSNYGKVLLFYRDGADHAASKGVVKMRISEDGGGNFGGETIIATDAIYDCRNVSGGVTPTGRIVLFYMRYNFTASTSFDQGFIYSDDDGSTWSNYQTIPSGTHTFFSPYGEMISIGNSKLMVCWYGESQATPTYSTYVITSSDNGLTWSSAIAVLTSTSLRYGESSYAYLDGGIIVGHVRNSNGSPLYQVISTNNGATWTNQGVTTVDTAAQVSPMLTTFIDPNNQKYIASFYANRGDNKLKVAIAEYATAVAGVSGWARTDIDSHTWTDFGYPTVVKSRENNKFLIAYYKAATTTLANVFFKNFTPNYGNIAVTGTISATGNVSSSANVSAVADVSGKDLKSSNTLQIKGVVTAFPTSGNGLEAYNSTATASIIQAYNRTTSVFNGLNFRGSILQFFIDATEAMRIHASRGVSIGNTTDLGAGTLNVSGNITTIAGTTANHVVVKSQLDLKANLASPNLTGTPTAPTATAGTNTTQLATTAFVNSAVSSASTSGSYTPTLTNVANITSSSIVSSATYTRIGNIVNVFISYNVNPTTSSVTSELKATLPINRTVSTLNYIGVASINNSSDGGSISGIVYTNTNDNEVIIYFKPLATGTHTGIANFQYSIN